MGTPGGSGLVGYERRGMRLFLFALWMAFLGSVARAQDQSTFLASLTPGRANVFSQTVVIGASPAWWTYITQNSDAFVPGLAGGLTRLAGNMGWGKTPEEWNGRIAVNIQFPPATNDAPSMHKVLQNLTYVAIPMVDPGYCHPRAGRFNLNISFDPLATVLAGNVSRDGGTYNLVSPIYSTLYTTDLQNFYKKGL